MFSYLQAAVGIANLIVDALVEGGMAHSEAVKKCWLFDSKGLVVKVRVCISASVQERTA